MIENQIEKISEGKFRLVLEEKTHLYLMNLMNGLSQGMLNEYGHPVNENLYHTMLARVVSSHFYKTINEIPVQGFVTIDVVQGNIITTISLGNIPNEDGTVIKLDGVLYNK